LHDPAEHEVSQFVSFSEQWLILLMFPFRLVLLVLMFPAAAPGTAAEE